MECNRDEALRAKEIAERKFLAKDYRGAKKFAIKAQKLYPELEGISQMMMTLEVYISAEEEKVNGETNWYGVLGVTRLADDDTIRKQYRKLALLLHPDKNRFNGAEGAFQLVSQAWSLLSDKSKKAAYDQRCGATFQQKNGKTKKESPSQQQTQNGFFNFAKNAVPQAKAPKGNSSKKEASSGPYQPRKKERHTFWTVCHRCKMQYEYLRMYLNRHLLCPNCNEAYFATEIEPPATKNSKTSHRTSNQQQQKHVNHQGSTATQNNSSTPYAGVSGSSHSKESNHNNFQWAPFTESTSAASAVKAANMVQQAYEKVKRERQKAQAATRREEALLRKNLASKRTGVESAGQPNAVKRRKVVENSGVSSETMKQGQKCTSKPDGVCHLDGKQLLMETARQEIRNKLNEDIATMMRNAAAEDVHRNIRENETTDVNDVSVSHGPRSNQDKLFESVETKSQLPLNKLNFVNSEHYEDGERVDQMIINVPDPEFYDFDKDRTEKCFGDNQVWAVYDDDDGMPRHYAMIHNVISLDPFKVEISWLNSTTNSRIGHGSLFRGGFSKTCGEFKKGKLEICNSLDSFSHKVRWMKCKPETIQIVPQKGEVWALYRNWSPEWNELTEDEVIYKYDLVEVLEDYNEELGVIVIPLVKSASFRAVFRQHFNPKEIRRIPRQEMSRFSHQVPSHLLTGQEKPKYIRGCRELDPAAIPSDILQVISKTEEIEFMETGENIEVVEID